MAFTYGIKLPGFNYKKIWVKEVNAKLYKDLVKSLYNNDTTEFLHHLNQVVEHVSPGILLDGLNVVDKIILLLNIRSVCISPDLKLEAVCNDTKKKFEYIIKIEDLVAKLGNIHYNKSVTFNNITINHSIVKAIDEINFINIEPEKMFSYQLASCIDSMTVNEKFLSFKGLTFSERIELVEKLPLTLATEVYKSLTRVEDSLADTKLLSIKSPYTGSYVVNLSVSTNTEVLLEFCKLIFNDDLINLYKINLNLISKANFTPEYVDSITPAEQLLYWTLFVQQAEKEQSEANSGSKSRDTSVPGFNGMPLDIGKNSPSEFT